jgi:hypothetical protein
MADSKISALPASTTPLAGTEVLPIVQSGVTNQVSVANLTAGRAITALSVNASGGTLSAGGTANGIFSLNRSDGATNLGYITWVASSDEMRYYNNNGGFHGFYVSSQGKLLTVAEGYSADTKFYVGNLVQGTAAKGINFTANTPAAGKTSQLLNWYEEGTWTPTWNGGTVTITSSYYTRVGRLVTWILDVTFGTSATATDSQLTLPFTATGSWGSGSINYSDYGTGMTVNIDAGSNRLLFRSAVNSSNLPCSSVASHRFICVATYFS